MRRLVFRAVAGRTAFRIATVIAVMTVLSPIARLPLAAQSESQGLFLLLPIGARAVGLGEGVVAQQGGTEQVWWNPAGIVAPKDEQSGGGRELAIHHAQTLMGQSNMLSFVLPAERIGTFAASIHLLNIGQQSVTDEYGAEIGTFNPMNIAYLLTYAARPLKYLTLGVTAKRIELRTSCSGACASVPLGSEGTSGADVGALVQLPNMPLTIGLAARSLGIGEGPTKPGRLDLGARYRIEAIDKYANGLVEAYASGSFVTTMGVDSLSTRTGLEIVVEERLVVRGGYIIDRANGSGAAIGVGFAAGRFSVDIARTFGGILAQGEQQPTYFSLRYRW